MARKFPIKGLAPPLCLAALVLTGCGAQHGAACVRQPGQGAAAAFAGERPAMLAAVAASVALGCLLPCGGLLACGVLGRRRLAAWDADWQATEPRWTRRRWSTE